VTVVDDGGLGGSAVRTDAVPSKTLVATAEVVRLAAESAELGVRFAGRRAGPSVVGVDLAAVNARVRELASAQSADIARRLGHLGVRVARGWGRLDSSSRVRVVSGPDAGASFDADTVLVATGAHPRTLPDAVPDGERILTWTQLYGLGRVPDRLIVVGSGVTGAEFASAYRVLGAQVVLVSSRERVLPGEDQDAAQVVEDVFARRGMQVLARSRAASVRRTGDGVLVTLTDGRTVEGTHCLLAVGSVPNTADIGLAEAGVTLDSRGYVEVDRVSRTSAAGVYAAGDCTGVLMLASVAAMAGRIAMYHALGEAVSPLDLRTVSSTVFTDPEIATVGASEADVVAGRVDARVVRLPLSANPRAKMQGVRDGFVKVFARPGTGTIVGGVVVAPRASELVHPLALAVSLSLTVDQLASAFTVYPSLSGSIAEAARMVPTVPLRAPAALAPEALAGDEPAGD
jgi:dihydrolipoamide dehydrogenase